MEKTAKIWKVPWLGRRKDVSYVCVCGGGESRLEDVQSHRGREGPGMRGDTGWPCVAGSGGGGV